MQRQIQTWKHFTRKLNIYYEKKFMNYYFLGLENHVPPKHGDLIFLCYSILKYYKDQNIQLLVVLCPILLDFFINRVVIYL
jgi:hypothetical protein